MSASTTTQVNDPARETSQSSASSLLPQDIAIFQKLGIPLDLLAAAGVERVTDREARDKYGIRFAPSADCGGILFPYHVPRVHWRVGARLRRDHPELGADGREENKYLCPYGDRRHLYYPPDAKEKLADPEMSIVLVEAEKSVLAVTAWAKRTGTRILPLGLGGCWGWRGKNVRSMIAPNGERIDLYGPLPDLHDCDGRKVFICLDSNCAINFSVQWARVELTVELSKPERGCTLRICDLTVVR